ncbi:hypothetical protein MPTK1_2g16980 [Marchantia polymorpha subsp. ruderalis]|uniref:DUF7780 domain-containing protein n=1 Tax=Marchantia polymorpha TaxID=3197 RepID=A0A2R6WCN6_MARPO|nr:hypothetical protein MARPO_0109s0039 [Marchantia polymorpha]BBN02651.1 hypothetical protein Mp_2g16980 [Marchantia polymorpha subsp. ruderalis]|eukprot:PTQ31609.1 hypothetical protein MARPO_0109s0039 [Marchantia polymorpha]
MDFMEHRLLDRKAASVGSGMGSRESLAEKPCPHSFNIEFRSTISLCVGILFVSIFVFCTLDPGKVLEQQTGRNPNIGLRFAPSFSFGSRFLQSKSVEPTLPAADGSLEPAMQGMGTLFRKGSQDMSELIVAHASENMSSTDFRLFLRTLHRSGATAKADVILLYDCLSARMMGIMQEEEMSFQRLLAESEGLIGLAAGAAAEPANSSVGAFNIGAFWKPDDRSPREVVSMIEESDNATLPRWGSMIGFEMQELDPDNALKGFLDMPSMQLRRWLGYQMLLGVVKAKYKHVMLTEIEGVMIIGDALSAVRRKQHIYLSTEDRLWSDVEKVEKAGTGNVRSRKILLEVEDSDDNAQEDVQDSAARGAAAAAEANNAKGGKKVEAVESGGGVGGQKETGDKKLMPEDLGKRKVKKPEARRKNSRRGRGSRGGQPLQEKAKGLIETIYGRDVWNSLEKFEKSRNVVSSGVIIGEVKLMRPLANKMATEIVRVALERQDRQPFHDKAILNYLVCKSSVLGRRTLDRLRLVGNKDSVVHSLRGTKQKNVFWRGKTVRYSVVHGYRDEIHEKGTADSLQRAVQSDICKSSFSSVYVDCTPDSNETRSSL